MSTENQDLRNDKNWKEKALYGLHADTGFPLSQQEFESLRSNQPKTEVIKISVSSSEMKALIEANQQLAKEKDSLQLEKDALQKEVDKSEKPIHVPAGTIPNSMNTPARQSGFCSIEELIDDVNLNKDVRNKLLHKVLSGVVQGKLSLPSYVEPEPETTTSDLGSELKLSKHPDVLGLSHRHRTLKLRERAKVDSKAQEILNSGNY